MNTTYIVYLLLSSIVFITVLYFGNSPSLLKKEKKCYEKLLTLDLMTRLFYLVLAWFLSTIWIGIAYQYDLIGLSILGMFPFVLVCFLLVSLPLWDYVGKRIATLACSDDFKDCLNFLNVLLLLFTEALGIFIIGHSILLVKMLV